MKCPFCEACQKDSCVIETRQRSDGRSIRRRRQCRVCSSKFTTREYTVKDLQETLNFKQNLITENLAVKCSYAMDDLTDLAQNLKEIQLLLNALQQQAIGSFIDDRSHPSQKRHAAL